MDSRRKEQSGQEGMTNIGSVDCRAKVDRDDGSEIDIFRPFRSAMRPYAESDLKSHHPLNVLRVL